MAAEDTLAGQADAHNEVARNHVHFHVHKAVVHQSVQVAQAAHPSHLAAHVRHDSIERRSINANRPHTVIEARILMCDSFH